MFYTRHPGNRPDLQVGDQDAYFFTGFSPTYWSAEESTVDSNQFYLFIAYSGPDEPVVGLIFAE